MAAANAYTNVTALNDADEFVLWQAGAVVNVTWSAFRGVIDDWFLPLTGGTLTGSLTVAPAAGAANSTLNAPAGSNAVQRFEENSVLRAAVFWNGTADTFIGVCYDTGGANAQNAWRATWGAGFDLYYAGSIKTSTAAHGLDVTGLALQSVQFYNIVETDDVTINDNVRTFQHFGSTTRSSATLRMPANPQNGQIQNIGFYGAITTLTHLGNTGQTVRGALTTAAANSFAAYVYRTADATWYRCG